MLKQRVKMLTGLLAVLFIFSCTDHDIAIYYYLEHEQQLAKNAFSEGMSVNGMVKTDGGRFFIAAGPAMWTRASDGWDQIKMPSGAINSTALGLFTVLGSERLYVGCVNGLFYSENDPDTSPKPTWKGVAGISGQVTRIKEANGHLFVSASDGKSTLYSIDSGGTLGKPIVSIGNKNDTLIGDVIYDGINYLAVAGSRVYSGTATSMTPIPSQPGSSERLYSIIYTNDHHYYVSSEDGRIYYSEDLSTWDETSTFEASNAKVKFRHFAQIPVPNGKVLVGASGGQYGAGYFTAKDEAIPQFERATIITVQQIYNGVVDDFFIDASTKTVYALNMGTGIWKNTYDDTTGNFIDEKDWKQE